MIEVIFKTTLHALQNGNQMVLSTLLEKGIFKHKLQLIIILTNYSKIKYINPKETRIPLLWN